MNGIRILVANEPRTYREALTAALRELRPLTQVITGEPDDLDGAVSGFDPQLVICSRLTALVRTCPIAWVLLYPAGRPLAVIGLAGQQRVVADLGLDGFLSLIDRTAQLACADERPDRAPRDGKATSGNGGA